VLVTGGSLLNPGELPQGTLQATWNTFESLIVDARATPVSTALIKDSISPGAVNPFIAAGPGTPGGSPTVDWFEEYPRLHMLSTGELFFSGYAPRWAKVDPNVLPIAWTRDPGPTFSSNWQHPRHDAPSLLFPNIVPSDTDRIMRIGGGEEHFYFPAVAGATATVETIAATTPGATWNSAPPMPGTVPGSLGERYLMNAVTLPDGGIFVFGGERRQPGSPANPPLQPAYEGLLFKNGVWTSQGSNPVASIRDYHSSGVLLPDGRVFIGGGNNRNWDYEIFSPSYRTNSTLIAQKPTNVTWDTAPFFDPNFDAFDLDYDADFLLRVDPLPTGVSLDKVVLMAPGSVTHHSDMNQRYIGLDIHSASDSKIAFRTPLDAKRAPRGIYMLFLVTTSGAVSDALWVFFA
jgi:hypothetical protein